MMKPLISVLVITYNHEKFIYENLTSIYNQTYHNIELIISDDCSIDKTLLIVKQWISEHQSRFTRIKLLTTDKNTGTTKNINRGLSETKGEYIKIIAGDDVLLNDALKKCLHYLQNNNEKIIVTSVQEIYDNPHGKTLGKIHPSENLIFFYEYQPADQFRYLLHNNPIPAPSAFYHNSLLDLLGKFDEDFVLLEDYPMWLRITLKNIHIGFLPEVTVLYRVHSDSIMNQHKIIPNPLIFFDKIKASKKYIFPNKKLFDLNTLIYLRLLNFYYYLMAFLGQRRFNPNNFLIVRLFLRSIAIIFSKKMNKKNDSDTY